MGWPQGHSYRHDCYIREWCSNLSNVQKWAAEFKRGRDSLEDDRRSGRPGTATTQENIDRVHHVVMDERRLTVNRIYICCRHLLRTSREHSTQRTWHVEGFSSVGATALTPNQKHTRLVMSQANLARFEADPASFPVRFFPHPRWVFCSPLRARDQTTIHAVETPLFSPSKEGQSAGPSPTPIGMATVGTIAPLSVKKKTKQNKQKKGRGRERKGK